MITRIANPTDQAGILALQECNHFDNLSAAEKESGFVTTRFTPAQLDAVLAEQGLFVAEHEGEIIAYTMAASWDFFMQWPIFPFMLERLASIPFNGQAITKDNSFQYGPICVASAWRGSDCFTQLFATMRGAMQARYPIGITFINRINQRSYHAHTRKLGMQVIDEFSFNERNYYGLAFPCR